MNDLQRFILGYGKHALKVYSYPDGISDCIEDAKSTAGQGRWTPDKRSLGRYGVVDPDYQGAHRHQRDETTGTYRFQAMSRPDGHGAFWMAVNVPARCTDTTCSRCYGDWTVDIVNASDQRR